ncbi:MAG TPA: malonic semialdehyde reductase [Candidatus Limnocylindria bacterium]|nr:malonic semialdehyde reductase [Candidatus Limnocylindria bacterium]
MEASTPTLDEIVAAKTARALEERALRTLFLEGRSANGFLERPVPRELLERIVELTEHGPTSTNSLPARFVFVTTPEGKERLREIVSPGNLEKTLAAPVTAIVAADLHFYEHMHRTFPHRDVRANFAGEEKAATTRQFALTNATLQGAYFMLAARAVGLDAGPMGGFDRVKCDAEFFPDGTLASIFLINLGFGDDTKLFGRLPRLPFDEVARFV